MTKILLLSDTHGHMDAAILKHAVEADEIWHAGDIGDIAVAQALAKVGPLRAVHGNVDDQGIRSTYPEDLRFRCEDVEVFVTHIGGYPPKYTSRVRGLLDARPPKLFIDGHSHILKVMWDKDRNLLHMNPGACGRYGFHQVRTMLRFAIDGADIKDLVVVELGKR